MKAIFKELRGCSSTLVDIVFQTLAMDRKVSRHIQIIDWNPDWNISKETNRSTPIYMETHAHRPIARCRGLIRNELSQDLIDPPEPNIFRVAT